MSRSDTQLCLQDRPTQQEVQRSASVDRQDVSYSSCKVPSQLWAEFRSGDYSTSSIFTGGSTLFASAEGAHNTVWENVAANVVGSGAALTQPSRNERPTSVPRTSPSPPAGRVAPTKRGASLFTEGPALYMATAPSPISAKAASALEPSSSSAASQSHESTSFTGGPIVGCCSSTVGYFKLCIHVYFY